VRRSVRPTAAVAGALCALCGDRDCDIYDELSPVTNLGPPENDWASQVSTVSARLSVVHRGATWRPALLSPHQGAVRSVRAGVCSQGAMQSIALADGRHTRPDGLVQGIGLPPPGSASTRSKREMFGGTSYGSFESVHEGRKHTESSIPFAYRDVPWEPGATFEVR